MSSAVTVVLVGLAIHDWTWGRWTRVHYALVALAAVAFTALLWDWNLLWYRM